MRVGVILVLFLGATVLLGCGPSPNITVVNQCPGKVNVQLKPADGKTVNLNGIESGQEAGGNVGLGPLDVKAVFPDGGKEATSGLKVEEGGEYRLVIKGDPPGIFTEVE